MPTYDYQCTNCSHVFEAFQKISDRLLEVCPKCKGKLKRLIGSGAGIIFKGPGFYATDYKKASKPSDRTGVASCPKAKQGCSGCSGH